MRHSRHTHYNPASYGQYILSLGMTTVNCFIFRGCNHCYWLFFPRLPSTIFLIVSSESRILLYAIIIFFWNYDHMLKSSLRFTLCCVDRILAIDIIRRQVAFLVILSISSVASNDSFRLNIFICASQTDSFFVDASTQYANIINVADNWKLKATLLDDVFMNMKIMKQFHLVAMSLLAWNDPEKSPSHS